VGEEKGKDNCNEDCKEKGRTHRCWEKETFATYEGSVGCKEKSCREEVDPPSLHLER